MRKFSLRTLILALILGAVVALSGCSNSTSTESTEPTETIHGRVVAIVKHQDHQDLILDENNNDTYFIQACSPEKVGESIEAVEGYVNFQVPVSLTGEYDSSGIFVISELYPRWHWRQTRIDGNGGWEYYYAPDQLRVAPSEEG